MPRRAIHTMRYLAVLASMVLVSVAGPASAHRMHLKELITESSVQRTLVWTMSAEIMRLTLKIDEQGSRTRLREAHEEFGQSLTVLRRGITELQGRDVANADAMAATFTQATRDWAALDEALRPIWDGGANTTARSRELLDRSRMLGQSIEQLHMHFHHAANHYGVVTVIGMAIMTTERERSVGQRIAADFLAIALESDAEDRAALGESVMLFDGLLRALLYGDAERGLIPPPTVELRQTMSEVEAIWQQMAPHLSAAVAGDPLTRDPVDEFSALSVRLFDELGRAGEILVGLVPGGRS